jgi:hypothetical protein
MDGSDAGAGEHRHRAFRHHRHVDGDAVAPLHAELLERAGHADDLALQLGIGDAAHFPGWVVGLEDQRDGLALAGSDMAIDRIVADVERAVLEPLDADRIEAPVGDFGRRGEPVEPQRLLGPKAIAVLDRTGIHRGILLGGAIGALLGAGRAANPFVVVVAHGCSSARIVFGKSIAACGPLCEALAGTGELLVICPR